MVSFRLIVCLALAFSVAGCATLPPPAMSVPSADQKKSIAVMRATIATGYCSFPRMVLGRYDPHEKAWIETETIPGLLDVVSPGALEGKSALVAELSAGEYGIISFKCAGSRYTTGSTMSAKGRSQIIRTVYDKPLAIFELKPGEVVNIGSILPVKLSAGSVWKPGSFAVLISPIPQPILAEFAKAQPQLAAVMVERMMRKGE